VLSSRHGPASAIPTLAVKNMSGFKVGLASEILNARHSPTALVRANYLTAVASRVDSFWVDDQSELLAAACDRHTPQYLGSAKLIPKVDAYLEPWTMLGHLAARNRLGRLRLGVGVTDAGRRNPAITRAGRRYPESADPWPGPYWA